MEINYCQSYKGFAEFCNKDISTCSNWYTAKGHIGLGNAVSSIQFGILHVTDIFKAMLFIFKDLTDIVNDHQRGELSFIYLLKLCFFMPTSLIRPSTMKF